VFKNPPGDFAGRLLEECGLKGLRVGGAEISTRHANVIVNRGGATSADVLALMERMRREVADRFGVTLSPEVEFLGLARMGS
jgi:UDP-N-acetylmuramate dehydrogenase